MKTNIGLERLGQLYDRLKHRLFYCKDDNTSHVMTEIRDCIREIKQYEEEMLRADSKGDTPAKLPDIEFCEPKLTLRGAKDTSAKAISGPNSTLTVNGVGVLGVMSKEINITNKDVMLTVTMLLPEIVYIDE